MENHELTMILWFPMLYNTIHSRFLSFHICTCLSHSKKLGSHYPEIFSCLISLPLLYTKDSSCLSFPTYIFFNLPQAVTFYSNLLNTPPHIELYLSTLLGSNLGLWAAFSVAPKKIPLHLSQALVPHLLGPHLAFLLRGWAQEPFKKCFVHNYSLLTPVLHPSHSKEEFL